MPQDRSEPKPTELSPELLELIGGFEADHRDLIEAMRVFGISNVEYERAMRALYATPIVTSTSTQPKR